MLPEWFKEYLSYHRKERRGILALTALLSLLIAYHIYQRVFWKSEWEELELQYGPSILAFREEKVSDTSSIDTPQPWKPNERILFQFDPNTLDSAGWVALGFSPKQTTSILKYRNAGAKFRRPDDLKKLFMVDEALYAELQPYIAIKSSESESAPRKENVRPQWERSKLEHSLIELNSADTTELMKLKGIGSSFAKRIVKYRELLGGYTSKEQLLEVYGMDTARFNPITTQLSVDTLIRMRININSAEVKELMKHPYIDKNQAVAIVNYRTQHGAFRNLSELKRIHLIKEEDFKKLMPYCSIW